MSSRDQVDHVLEGIGKAPISHISWAPQNDPNSSLYLSTAAWDGNVRIYECMHGMSGGGGGGSGGGGNNRVQSRPLSATQNKAPVLSSYLTPNGQCYFGGCCKGVWSWDVASGSNPNQIGGHSLPVSNVRVLGPGACDAVGTVVSTGWDGKGCFWDVRQNRQVHEITQPGPITGIDACGPAISFMTSRQIALFDLRSMSIPLQIVPRIDPIQLQNRCVGLGTDLSFIVCGTVDGRIWRSSLEDNKQDQFKAHGGQVRTNEFDAFPVNALVVRGKTAVSCSSDGTVCFFDLAQLMKYNPTSPAPFPSPPSGTRAPITSISLSDDLRCLAYSISEDYTLGHNVAMASRVMPKICIKLITSDLRVNQSDR